MADILLVDDDSDVAEPLTLYLQMEGHKVRLAADGIQGLLQVARKLPDLILLDVEMPRMSGPSMVRELILRDSGREMIPVILLSGTADLYQIAQEVGTRYFLAKPYRLEELSEVLMRALTERLPPASLKFV